MIQGVYTNEHLKGGEESEVLQEFDVCWSCFAFLSQVRSVEMLLEEKR